MGKWEEVITITTANNRHWKNTGRCIAKLLGTDQRCKRKNGFGDNGLFCKQHEKLEIDYDQSGDCFYDLAPRYGD